MFWKDKVSLTSWFQVGTSWPLREYIRTTAPSVTLSASPTLMQTRTHKRAHTHAHTHTRSFLPSHRNAARAPKSQKWQHIRGIIWDWIAIETWRCHLEDLHKTGQLFSSHTHIPYSSPCPLIPLCPSVAICIEMCAFYHSGTRHYTLANMRVPRMTGNEPLKIPDVCIMPPRLRLLQGEDLIMSFAMSTSCWFLYLCQEIYLWQFISHPSAPCTHIKHQFHPISHKPPCFSTNAITKETLCKPLPCSD